MNENIQQLEAELMDLHDVSARRENCSTVCLLNSFSGSGDINKAVVAAISAFGTAHGPIRLCCELLQDSSLVSRYDLVPGFGCSFKEDQSKYDKVRGLIDPEIIETIDAIASNLPVGPNIAIYTAAYAVMTDMPPVLAPSLIIKFRLRTWINIIQESFNI